ncbi:hypothetical protein Tco_0304280, partial [Tanacetum coccineum]
MTNSEHPSPPPTLTLVEKLYAVHNINSLIPEKLDLGESNYSTWSYFFKGHCSNFGVLKHIKEPVTEASTSTPPTDEWITADSIVKSWIFITLSSTLRKRSLAQIIAHNDPFPDLATVRSMVAMEELRLRSRSSVLSTGTTSSAPQVLLKCYWLKHQVVIKWDGTIVNGTTVPQHVRCVIILDVAFVIGAMLVVSFMTPLIPQDLNLVGQSRLTAPPGFQSGQQPAQQAFSPQQQALLSG